MKEPLSNHDSNWNGAAKGTDLGTSSLGIGSHEAHLLFQLHLDMSAIAILRHIFWFQSRQVIADKCGCDTWTRGWFARGHICDGEASCSTGLIYDGKLVIESNSTARPKSWNCLWLYSLQESMTKLSSSISHFSVSMAHSCFPPACINMEGSHFTHTPFSRRKEG